MVDTIELSTVEGEKHDISADDTVGTEESTDNKKVKVDLQGFVTPLVTLLKAIADYLFTKNILPPLGQEAMSEMIESSLCIFESEFCSTLFAEGIGNAIAVVIVELLKLLFRCKQYNNGQMIAGEFWNKTIVSLVKGLTIGGFSFAIQAFLTYFTFGCAALCPWIAGFVGSVIESLVGNILGRVVASSHEHISID
ncbi:unnamed protein product [Didymodactylos carnosus]|uniref:Uncharacterized protein n=1 Tax=Didymodactylos carnosus TaxID=1234261 RepID=A0A8S2RR71_9BILA|nr:unnamed protein product [Didymodactylos carnosus]CAF4177247.1 unnamed protein product [Didymodactylos carnosus]